MAAPAARAIDGGEIGWLSVVELSRRLAAGALSPVEVTEAHLRRIEALDPRLNAFITVCADQALKAAREAAAAISRGRRRGPLHGIPFAAKDLFDAAGVRTTFGASFHRDRVSDSDAESIRRLKAAGAILLGKCNTGELGTGSTTKNDWYGPCRNPWDPSRVAGGSSGGSAAAVAAGLCPAATGSDAGGSIRGPAALCGAVGLMPTYGRVSLGGGCPGATSLAHVGPIARSARDCALVLQAMAGYDAGDPNSADVAVPDFSAEINRGVAGLRLGISPDLVPIEIDGAVAEAFERALAVLVGLGARIQTVAFPLARRVEAARSVISDGERIEAERARFGERPEGYGEFLRKRLERASRVTVDAYVRACREREIIRRGFAELFRTVDAILLPAYASAAAPIDTLKAVVNGREVPFESLGVRLLGLANVTGTPAIAVPTGFSPDGLPLSMQILGPAWSEPLVLRIAAAYEEATPEVRARRPTIGP